MNVAPNESGRNIWRKSFMSMSGKIASFIMSLVLIGWKVIDIFTGRANVLTWVLLGVFTVMGLFELIDICETGHKTITDGDHTV